MNKPSKEELVENAAIIKMKYSNQPELRWHIAVNQADDYELSGRERDEFIAACGFAMQYNSFPISELTQS